MIANLVWAPAAGGGTQTIQFQVNGASTWITYTTIGPSISTIGVTGLDYDTLYNFRIINNCPTGSTTQVLGSAIAFHCPSLLISPADTSVSVQFFDLGGTISSYLLNLLDTGNNVLQTKMLTAPFDASITTLFTGLTPLTSYNLQISPRSGSFVKTDCPTLTFQTSNTPICPPPIGLAVTFS